MFPLLGGKVLIDILAEAFASGAGYEAGRITVSEIFDSVKEAWEEAFGD